MSRKETDILEQAGFTQDQIEALESVFSHRHHTHEIEDVIGLEEELDLESGDDSYDEEE